MDPQHIHAEDGTEGWLLIDPAPPADAPVWMLVPGMGMQARWYRRLAGPVAAAGLRLAVVEWRGHGRSPVRPSRSLDWGYRELVGDIASAARHVRATWPAAPLIVGGHSLGGQLSAVCLALHPSLADGLFTVAACSVWWRSFPGLGGPTVLLGTHAAAALGVLWGSYPGERVGFAKREARGVIADWAHQGRTGRYRLRGAGVDPMPALAASPTPACMVSLEGDTWAPPSAVDHLAALRPARRVHVQHPSLKTLPHPHLYWTATPEPIVGVLREFRESLPPG